MKYREQVKLFLPYLYLSEGDREKLAAVDDSLGWNKPNFFNQCLSSFAARNADFYQEALEQAAAAMEVEEGDLYNLLRDGREPEIPPYKTAEPDYGVTPLSAVVNVSTEPGDRFRLSPFDCSGRNVVTLRLAALVQKDSAVLTLSRIIRWHFDNYWAKAYATQIENDLNRKLKEG